MVMSSGNPDVMSSLVASKEGIVPDGDHPID